MFAIMTSVNSLSPTMATCEGWVTGRWWLGDVFGLVVAHVVEAELVVLGVAVVVVEEDVEDLGEVVARK